MPDLTNVEEIEMTTPFGKPSDRLTLGTLHGRRLAFYRDTAVATS